MKFNNIPFTFLFTYPSLVPSTLKSLLLMSPSCNLKRLNADEHVVHIRTELRFSTYHVTFVVMTYRNEIQKKKTCFRYSSLN